MLISTMGLAQKNRHTVEDKTGVILTEGVVTAKLIKTKATLIGLQKNFSIRDQDGDEVLYV